jgi:hypothetical protein
MRDRLRLTWEERVQRARQWQAPEEPTPVLEALAQALVWHLVGGVEELASDDRQALEEVADAAMAQAKERAMGGEDDRGAWLEAVALAELGRAALQGRTPELSDVPADLHRPTPRRVASMLDGRLDGLSAAACAVWCLKHDPSEARLLWSLGAERERERRDSEPLLVAAADREPMRAPDEGRLVATHEDTGVEAVWFDADRELALYAPEDVYVALAAPGVTTKDVRPGYWLGTVEPSAADPVRAQLKVGEQSWEWAIGFGGRRETE